MCARQIKSRTQNKPCTVEKRNICDTCLIALYKLEIRATLDNVSKMPLSKSKVMVKLNSCGLFNNISFFYQDTYKERNNKTK